MTAINFPVTTATGSVFTFGDRTWTWTGGENGFWRATSTTIGYTGSVGYVGSRGPSGSATNPWFTTNTNYIASDGDRIIADNEFGSFQISLPAYPYTGSYIQITDGNDFSNGNPVQVVRNGSTIETLYEDVNLDLKGSTFEFIYNGATWQVTSTTGPKGNIGYTGSIGANTVALQQPGNLVVFYGTARWYAPYNCSITSIIPRVRIAADNNITLNLLKNNVVLQNQTILANATSASADTTGYTLNSGDYLTVNVLSVGSNLNPGVDLYVQIQYIPI